MTDNANAEFKKATYLLLDSANHILICLQTNKKYGIRLFHSRCFFVIPSWILECRNCPIHVKQSPMNIYSVRR